MSDPNPFVHCQHLLPKHVAIILDGNGRWAQLRGKKRFSGHRAGVKAVREAVANASAWGLEALTIYAFSSENWRRPQEEVDLLMELFLTVLRVEVKRLNKNNVRLRIIGDTSRFSPKLQQRIADAEARTAGNSGMVLNVAANYGGRWDVVQSVRQLAEQVRSGQLLPEDIDEAAIGQGLTTDGLPELDLMIRTGGDLRISNFLIWQAAYTELYFTDKLWPDFDKAAFIEALNSFMCRQRRFGQTGAQVELATTKTITT